MRNIILLLSLTFFIIMSLSACTYRDLTTYRLWANPPEPQFVEVSDGVLSDDEITKLKENNIQYYKNANGIYYVERKSKTGEIVEDYTYKILATPFTVTLDGVIITVCAIISSR